MRLHRLLRTVAFRLAALYSLLFGMSVLILMAVVFTLVERSVTSQIAATVRIEAEAMAEDVDGGRVPDAATDPSIRRFAQRGDGSVAVGEIVPKTRTTGIFKLSAADLRSASDEDDEDTGFIGYGLRLRDGGYVLAAQDDERVSETREAIVGAFTIALAVALSLSIVGGALLSWLYLRRIESFNTVARAIFEGGVERRMPVSGSDDELDRLGANLNRMLDRIAQLVDTMRQVSADIAHDLRTPLGRLRQKLERLAVSEDAATSRALAGHALIEADAILETFGALLRIAQLESGDARSGFGEVDLSGLVGEIGELYAAVAHDGGRSLDVSVAPGLLFHGDRSLLQQLLVNVVENALTHTPTGSHVRISLRGSRSGWAAVVSDDGPGISAAEREKIFDRFYRAEKSRSTPGTGLGLALARAIASIHGIELSASDNAPGTRITMTFGKGARAPGAASST